MLSGLDPDAVKRLEWSMKGLFARWCEFVQSRQTRRLIIDRFATRRVQYTKARIFYAWKTG